MDFWYRSGQARHGAGDLGAYLVGQRCVPDLRRGRLPVRAGGVGQERLDQRKRAGRGALLADDLVGDQHDRVRPRGRGVVVDRERHVVAGAGRLGAGHGLAGRLTGEFGVLPGPVADLGHLQVAGLGEGPLDVPDGAVGLPDRRRNTVGALLGVAAGRLPGLVVAVGPVRAGGLGQELGEVVGGTRAVRPVYRQDLRGRQRGALVVRGDRRVVPGGPLAREDLDDGGR